MMISTRNEDQLMFYLTRKKMENAETQLREIHRALKHCDLDYREILEDYREHLKDLEQKSGNRVDKEQLSKQIKRRSA